MCNIVVIVTRWWLTWLLVSVACVMCLLGANLSPSWLMGPIPSPTSDSLIPRMSLMASDGGGGGIEQEEGGGEDNAVTTALLQGQIPPTPAAYHSQERPSLGLWIRCTLMGGYSKSRLHCGVYATSVPDLPHAQVVALVAIASATVLTSLSCLAILSSTCIRIVRGANWFNIIGAMQALAGVLSLVGVAVFPLAWGSDRIKNLCGTDADIYSPKYCSIGWAVYVTLLGSLGLLFSSWVSSVAAHSTTTNQVADEISKGKNIICLI